MTEATRMERLRAELDDGSADSPFADLLAVWAGLADAFWLGTLRAVLASEPPARLTHPAPHRGSEDAARYPERAA
ncbi:MAG: hypothetical protein V2J24_13360 [Pseudomonadales bacterium]|jgi:hypothetical protein|nr:hypothetical protein [Pseudomonadales bacterium]